MHKLISDIATELNINKSTALKIAKRFNFDILKVRTTKSGNQNCAALSMADYETFLKLRHDFNVSQSENTNNVCYIIVPDKSLMPNRIKVGVTNNLASRLSTYKTICPLAEIVYSIEAPSSCEGYMIAVADSMGNRVGVEVFDINCIKEYVEIIKQAFKPFEKQSKKEVTT